MAGNLVVVESPAKARTIKKYLGHEFEVMASYGHVRDLRPKSGAVEPDNGFAMHYEIIDKNEKQVVSLKRAMKKADALYLATDPDREGEAIAWHVVELLRAEKLLDSKPVHRIVFHEITRRAVQESLEHSREVSMSLVNAQQARRALDYLVGFNLSPLLWKKIRRGLSAGRVQSPALRMIAEREIEIEKFIPREYWSIEADLLAKSLPFGARLSYFSGEKLGQFSIVTDESATKARTALTSCAEGKLKVVNIEKKQRRRNPAAPFTTSTLQQEAARKLGYSAQRTMRLAQQLYEGVAGESGMGGLITYMRTDSVTLAAEALSEIREFVTEKFGADKLPEEARTYKTKAKNAQEAHEAVRPTSVQRMPSSLKDQLNKDQLRLYELIWKRTVACQMLHATIDTVAADMIPSADTSEPSVGVFRATGSTISDPGFLAVYEEGVDDGKAEDNDRRLPPLAKGELVELVKIRCEQHFTEPPPRYSEATLIRTLEDYGIGRPSTYASIISTLLQREYVELESRRFHPTDVGRLVNGFLTDHFGSYVDYEFTARLEDALDAIARCERDWIPLLEEFWGPFNKQVKEKEETVSRKEASQARDLGVDPASGLPVSVRMGRFGPYAQIGSREDEEKPRFAGLHSGQRMSSLTLEDALELFKLPRELGQTDDGEPVSTTIGRFGPYVRYEQKYASLGKDDDPYTLTLERALELIAEKKAFDAAKEIQVFDNGNVRVLKGRYGPYVTNGKRNARVPKDSDPSTLTYEEALGLIEKAPAPKARRRRKSS